MENYLEKLIYWIEMSYNQIKAYKMKYIRIKKFIIFHF